MKALKKNRAVFAVVLLALAIAIATYLVWPKGASLVSDELIVVIKPGMTLNETRAAIGDAYFSKDTSIICSDRDWIWVSPTLGLKGFVPKEVNPFTSKTETTFWVSDKQRLLWVESQNGKITQTWILPLVRNDDE